MNGTEPVSKQPEGPFPGQQGGPCIGANALCDKDEAITLECIDGLCQAPKGGGVLDQSVCIPPLK
jgi:hypothetical protein